MPIQATTLLHWKSIIYQFLLNRRRALSSINEIAAACYAIGVVNCFICPLLIMRIFNRSHFKDQPRIFSIASNYLRLYLCCSSFDQNRPLSKWEKSHNWGWVKVFKTCWNEYWSPCLVEDWWFHPWTAKIRLQFDLWGHCLALDSGRWKNPWWIISF